MNYQVDEKGFYGEFGGAFIPEMLYPNIEELRLNYLKITAEPSFKKEFMELLVDYVGRPTPLYFAKRLSEQYNTKIYLKREDLCHTGAHKINNTIGQNWKNFFNLKQQKIVLLLTLIVNLKRNPVSKTNKKLKNFKKN